MYLPYALEVKIVTELFGDGIFWTDGDVWGSQRKMSQPLFMKNSLDSMNSVFVEKAQIVCSILEKHAKR